MEQVQGASARDYGFLMFLTLLNVMNFVDRQLLASFANWIVPDLGLSNTQFGLLTVLSFIFFYIHGTKWYRAHMLFFKFI